MGGGHTVGPAAGPRRRRPDQPGSRRRGARRDARGLRPSAARPAVALEHDAGGRAARAADDADAVLERFAGNVLPALRELPAQLIHNDANEHNVLVGDDGSSAGLIDFGDVCRAPRVCGLAVACAYAMPGTPSPVRAVLPLVAGYHEVGAARRRSSSRCWTTSSRTRLAMSVVHGGAPVRRAAGQRVPADQPARGRRAAAAPRGREPASSRTSASATPAATSRAAAPARCGAYLAAAEPARSCRRRSTSAPARDCSPARTPPPPATRPAIGRYRRGARASTRPPHSRPSCRASGGRCTSASTCSCPPASRSAPRSTASSRAVAHRARRRTTTAASSSSPETRREPFCTLYGHLRASAERLAPGDAVAARRRGRASSATSPRTAAGRRTCTCSCSRRPRARPSDRTASARSPRRDVWRASARTRTCCSGSAGAAEPRPRARRSCARRAGARSRRALSLSYREPLKIVARRGRAPVRRATAAPTWTSSTTSAHVGHCPSARRGRGRGADGAAEHQHALPARRLIVTYARRLAATLPDPLQRRLLRQLRQRGERPRAAARDARTPARARSWCSSTPTTATSAR